MDTWRVTLNPTSISAATVVVTRISGTACPFSSVTYNLIHDWHPLRDGIRFKIEDETALEYGFPCYLCVSPQVSGGS